MSGSSSNPYGSAFSGPPTTVSLQQMADLVNNGANLVRALAQVVQALQNPSYTPVHIVNAGTTVCKAAPGSVHALVVNSIGSASTLTIFNNTTATGTILAIPAFATTTPTPYRVEYDATASIGITAVVTGTVDLTMLIV